MALGDGVIERNLDDARRSLLARLARPAGAEPLSLFCSGIGGTGLSGLARLARDLGHRVRGSDRRASAATRDLEAAGVQVATEQRAENLNEPCDVFVATAALPADHPELAAAQARGVPVVKYAEALGAFVAARRGVAVAGTHGKTTTTSMLSFLLDRCGQDPSYVVGGVPLDLDVQARIAGGDAFVFEACEFDRSFRHYVPSLALILNVEEDHFDCYQGGIDEIVDAFVDFATRIQEGGTLLVSADWPHALRVAEATRQARPDVRVETFAVERDAQVRAQDVQVVSGLPSFELVVEGQVVATVRLRVPGLHNVSNALAAISAAIRLGVAPADAARAVEAFRGVRRRFEVVRPGPDVVIVDDYAHHPTAVRAVIEAARQRYPHRRVVVCFEPHQANRTRSLFQEFAHALSAADRVLLADVYVCRDRAEDVDAVCSADLAQAVAREDPATEARAVGAPSEVSHAALGLLEAGDVALFLGAGQITLAAREVAAALQERAPAVVTSRAASWVYPRPLALERSLERALGGRLRLDEPLGPHCTLKAGGHARFFCAPRSTAEAIHVARAFMSRGVPLLPLGGGSNVLFATDRFDGAVLLTKNLRGLEVRGRTLRAPAGQSLQGTIRAAERAGLGGLAEFAGIPGTLGGAVFGNAGGGLGAPTVGDRVRRVRVLEADGRIYWRSKQELGLRYRHSGLKGALILDVELELVPANRTELRQIRQDWTRRKAEVQPVTSRSAGCTFRNPTGESAGRLIDRLGLKGLSRGDAQVSPLHGNFIVNAGQADWKDVVALMNDVRERVRRAHGLTLQTEVRLIA
ncbi:MAG: UDP-N-acetylmuramate--L-alanine ligase [Planctomycetes bacterium]|nr:UDP-N-acetylmuramate--L-alanine ligase [Planctomycetota bacterium]